MSGASSRFHPGWLPTIVMLVAVAILMWLGTWQVRRHHWRQADIAAKNAQIDMPPLAFEVVERDPGEARFRRARVRGTYDHAESIVVGSVIRDGREGARILTPLRLSGRAPDAPALLVDRGWAPYREIESVLEKGRTAASPVVEVTGLVFEMELGDAEPGSAEQRRLEWVRFDPSRAGYANALQAQLPYRLAPFLLQREDDGDDALPIGEMSRPGSPVDHVMYAVTWYSLGVAAFGTWVGLGISQARDRRRAAAKTHH